MTSAETSERSIPTARRRHVFWIVVLAVVGSAAAISARAWLLDVADPANINPDPLPRKGLNAPFIKSADPVVDKMIEMGSITDEDFVYDLGCGDGKILISAAVQRGCRGVGFDIEPKRVEEAEQNAKASGVDSLVTFKQQDVFTVDLREANVIVMYLLPWMMEKLVAQFDQCPPGTRIVSHDFRIEGVKDQKVEMVPVEGETDHRVYLYLTPLEKLPHVRRKAVIE